MQEWISVKDRLPNCGQLCIVSCGPDDKAQIMATSWNGEEFVWADGAEYGESAFDPLPSEMVTYWMPFPEDPKQRP